MLMDILAGIISGLIMGTAFLGIAIFVLYANRDMYDRLAKVLPKGISFTMFMIALLITMPLAWALFGALAGALYNVTLDSAQSFKLGSSNSVFTLAILCVSILLLLPSLYLMFKRKYWGGILLSVSLTFAVIFGWLLPLLAHWR